MSAGCTCIRANCSKMPACWKAPKNATCAPCRWTPLPGSLRSSGPAARGHGPWSHARRNRVHRGTNAGPAGGGRAPEPLGRRSPPRKRKPYTIWRLSRWRGRVSRGGLWPTRRPWMRSCSEALLLAGGQGSGASLRTVAAQAASLRAQLLEAEGRRNEARTVLKTSQPGAARECAALVRTRLAGAAQRRHR